MKLGRKYYRLYKFAILVFLGLWLSLGTIPLGMRAGRAVSTNEIEWVQGDLTQLEEQAKRFYQNQDFEAAIELWQQGIQGYRAQGDQVGEAKLLSNLALGYQQLGQFSEAQEVLNQSLELLETLGDTHLLAREQGLAQALNTQGGLQFAWGQIQHALQSWQEAERYYALGGDERGVIRSQINQAQALEALGFYRRSLDKLQQVQQNVALQDDLFLQMVTLRSLGEMLRLMGDLDQSQQVLEKSLAIAQKLNSPEDIAATLLGLGNTQQGNQQDAIALELYQKADALPTSSSLQLKIQLSQLSLFIEQENWLAAQRICNPLQSTLESLSPSHFKVYSLINFGRRLTQWKQKKTDTEMGFSWQEIAQLFSQGVQQAITLGDQRGQAYALGYLGGIYEQTQQWDNALVVTQQALTLAQALNAGDISYQWQWQLGRIFNALGDSQKAISVYSEAVNTLESISQDLVTINPEVQFSFQESVEPVYRELVALLLDDHQTEVGAKSLRTTVNQQNLIKAREVIESLQLAELDNFFQEACLRTQKISIDQLDPQAAVVYPIILNNRLEVIVSLPQQPLIHYTTDIAIQDLQATIQKLRKTLVIRSRRDFFEPAQQLYAWLIHPVEDELVANDIQTLVFVLDGALRNIPMAALYDGEQYLIENYSIALAPGLRLVDPTPLKQLDLKALTAGLTQERHGFPALNNVALELDTISSTVPSIVLLDQTFTTEALQEKLESSSFPVIHIATHGQFSSQITNTFILAWDNVINLRQLDGILNTHSDTQETALELLVLSACETASGDKRAALGLAGMAIRAGAKSTVATLWAVNDAATTEFMTNFYREIATQDITKAEALRKSQLSLLKNPRYRHPLFWSPYVLVGNWL